MKDHSSPKPLNLAFFVKYRKPFFFVVFASFIIAAHQHLSVRGGAPRGSAVAAVALPSMHVSTSATKSASLGAAASLPAPPLPPTLPLLVPPPQETPPPSFYGGNVPARGPAYAPPPLAEGSRVVSPGAQASACSSWAYARIHVKEASLLAGDNDRPFQGGARDINELLPRIRAALVGARHITEIGVREAISSWSFAAVAAEAADAGTPIAYHASDITKKEGVADLEAALAQCPGVQFTYTEGSDLIVPPWRTDVMLLDTWHTYKQLSRELQRWAPYVASTLMLHDTTLFEDRDEDIEGHGGKPVDETHFAGLPQKAGLWAAVQEFLVSEEGKKWKVAERIIANNGLTVMQRESDEALSSLDLPKKNDVPQPLTPIEVMRLNSAV